MNLFSLGVVQNCHHFQVHRVCWGEWVNCGLTLFLNVDYEALHFHMGSLKINIFKVLFWEGGRGHKKKSTLCTLLIMLTIMDDP